MTDLSELKSAITEHLETTTDVLQDTRKDLKAARDDLLNTRAQVEKIEMRINRPGALAGLGGGAANGDLVAERKALGMFVRSGDDRELKSMEVGNDPAGGWLVMPAVSTQMTRRLWDASPIRRLARIQTMTTGDAWVEPLDRSESDASWVAETAARPARATPSLGMLDIPLNELYSSQLVTQKLLDLSFVDIGQWVEGKIADKFARSESAAFLTGDGIGKPMGILSHQIVSTGDATRAADKIQYIAGGSGSVITADSLRSVYWGLRAPYRSNATWLMSSDRRGNRSVESHRRWSVSLAPGNEHQRACDASGQAGRDR